MTDAAIPTAATPAQTPVVKEETPLRRFVAQFLEDKVAVFGLVLLAAVVALALAAPLIAPQNPYDLARVDLMDSKQPPGEMAGDGFRMWLGSDGVGRDLWSGILYGLRISLAVGAISGIIAASVGMSIGLIAAYAGGRVESILMRIVDLQLSLPTVLVALILVAMLGKGVDKIIIALVIVQWAYYARTVRGSALVERRKEYVEAAQSLGLSHARIVFRHILPNVVAPVIVIATVQTAHAIALEATLSFLGVGLPQTEPSLGVLIANGFQYLLSGSYWISTFPGDALLPLAGEGGRAKRRPDEGPSMTPVLSVSNLRTHFFTRAGVVKSVDGVSFDVARGQVLGLVGESGSGKTVTGFSVMGLVDPPGRIVDGSIKLNGREIVGLPEREMRRLRGREAAMIFQDPMMTLNPVLRIDTQMMEAVTAHEAVTKEEARQRSRDALGLVGISSPEERLKAYPHQFSGGMRQRVAIAIALLNRPSLIVCDEPTTALDVTIQSQILAEMQRLCAQTGTALIWVTHDLTVVAGLADRIAVMYAGRIVESGSVDEVLDRPIHPYAFGLLGSVPSRGRRGEPLLQIPGAAPSLARLPEGCAFRPRCTRATEVCRAAPEEEAYPGGRTARCFHPMNLGEMAA